MVALLPTVSQTFVKAATGAARSFDSVRRTVGYGLCGIVMFAAIAYVTFLIGTTVSAAERRAAMVAIHELTTATAKEEAQYLSLLAEVNKKEVVARGFIPTDPTFVVRSSIAKSFSLVHVVE